MGKTNRQRRAAKRRRHTTHHQGGHRQPSLRLPPERPERPAAAQARSTSVRERIDAAVHECDQRGPVMAELAIDRLALADDPRPAVVSELRWLLGVQLDRLWDAGWQPADLRRAVGKLHSAGEARLVAWVVAAEADAYRALGRQVAPHWMRQVDAVAGAAGSGLDDRSTPWVELLADAIRLLHLLRRLPPVPVLGPPPSQWHPGMATATEPSTAPDGILDKVRALLAKAESTPFEAEAEAFTAKAQELMTRHRIDRAVLNASDDLGDAPAGRRLGIDDPYADAKVMLLSAICSANGARCVWDKRYGYATVFGYPVELEVIDELFTSLLVQSSAALRREGSKRDAYGRSRTKAFRRTFLVSFAQRIGERLQEAAEETVAAADADGSGALLPVLAARDAEVDEVIDRTFPNTRAFQPSASDAEGWYAGRAFGDRADLAVGAPVERRTGG